MILLWDRARSTFHEENLYNSNVFKKLCLDSPSLKFSHSLDVLTTANVAKLAILALAATVFLETEIEARAAFTFDMGLLQKCNFRTERFLRQDGRRRITSNERPGLVIMDERVFYWNASCVNSWETWASLQIWCGTATRATINCRFCLPSFCWVNGGLLRKGSCRLYTRGMPALAPLGIPSRFKC